MDSSDDEREGREKIEGAPHVNADSVDHSYATEEEEYRVKEQGEEEAEEAGGEEEEYYNSAAGFPAPLFSFSAYNNSNFQAFLDSVAPNFPVRSPPPPDVRVSVISSSIEKPTFSGMKGKGSVFSLSSFYDASGSGHIQRPAYLKATEAALRSVAAIFSLIVFCVMSSAREMRVAAGSTFEVKFSDFQAYNYLVALNVLSFAYSSAQVVVVLQSGSDGSGSGSNSIFASPIKSGIFKYLCDEILALCLFSASSSAATASQMSHYGLQNIWPPACETWKLWMFCSKADAAVVISFFSSFSVVLSSLFSGFYVVRLIALV